MERDLILIIDDDTGSAESVRACLELDGFRVEVAGTGRDGMFAAQHLHPSLILLDADLPDIDGIKICQILRRRSATPVLILTARDTVSDKVLGLECGADDYLVKPCNVLELTARVRAVLRRCQSGSRNVADCAGGIRMDFPARRVEVEGRTVTLTRTESALMELFAAHPGQTLSREFIRNQNWEDAGLYAQSRAIDVHVQRLRKKIEPAPQSPRYLLTVPGVGYRFEAC